MANHIIGRKEGKIIVPRDFQVYGFHPVFAKILLDELLTLQAKECVAKGSFYIPEEKPGDAKKEIVQKSKRIKQCLTAKAAFLFRLLYLQLYGTDPSYSLIRQKDDIKEELNEAEEILSVFQAIDVIRA